MLAAVPGQKCDGAAPDQGTLDPKPGSEGIAARGSCMQAWSGRSMRTWSDHCMREHGAVTVSMFLKRYRTPSAGDAAD